MCSADGFSRTGCRSRDGSRLLHRSAGGGPGQHGKPDIFNSDQGSQFTSVDFTGVLLEGRRRDQHGRQRLLARQRVRRRLWRSVKYEEVYLRAYDSVSEARSSIGRYLAFYNHRRFGTRALTGARPTRLTSRHRLSRRRHEFAARTFSTATPSVTPRARNCKGPTPATVHLAFAESCSEDRD